MNISEVSVRRPVLITMIFVLVSTVASIFLPKLDIALYPSVSMPMLYVSVSCNDAGPEEIELQVAQLLEKQLGSIEGLESITTSSSSGRCTAMLEFSYRTDLDKAADTVTNKFSSISRSLPSWADTPTLMRFDSSSSSSEILELLITGPYSQEDLKTIASDQAANLLLRIDGVADVTVRGGDNTKYEVRLDADRLNSLGLTMSQVSQALSGRNTQGSAGSFEQDGMSYSITLDQRFRTLEEIEQTVITVINGIEIKVSDVADVVVSSTSGNAMSYINGEPVVMMSVSNESDKNASSVANAVIEGLDEINSQLPTGVQISVQRNSTSMISSTMNEVYKSAIMGVVLAAIVIFIFLRGFKTTFIITISMPISILITLMVMSIAGITVNSMSMSGLILGIGMIVDSSICILENSYKFREAGYKPAVSAILGSKRMFGAIFASVATTVCVFLPLLIYRTELGSIGMMFRDLILTVCISLTASLFVAITLVPALFGSILSVNSRVQKPIRNRFFGAIDTAMGKFQKLLDRAYARALSYCLKHKFIVILLFVLLLVFALGFFTNIGMSLTPAMNTDDSVSLSVTLPQGTVRSVTLKEVFRVEELIENTLPEGSWTSISARAGGNNSGSLTISLPDITEQKLSASQIKDLIRPLLNGNASATWSFGGGRGWGSGSTINIEIHSKDSDRAKEAADMIASIIAEYVPEAQNITTDIANGSPKIELEIDEELANSFGLTASSILSTVRSALSGVTATTLNTFSSSNTYSLTVNFSDDSFQSLDDIGAILIKTSGGYVRLDTFVTFKRGTAARSISRENGERVNHITASAKEGYASSEVQSKVNAALDEHLILPDGVTLVQSGDMQQFQSYSSTLITIIVLALVLVYAVMAAQFESLSDPLIIFISIPMFLIGVVIIHLVMDQDFSLFSIVGMVALIGVVVNNGIVLVDSINYEVRHKKPIYQSCLLVAMQRLRPILMTTLTTILGMVPMAFFPGDGAEMMQPIALTFVGGMITGAFSTLFLTPVLYSVINKRRERHFEDPMSLTNQLLEYDTGKLEI